MADAGVHDAQRTRVEQPLGQRLRCNIAPRIDAAAKPLGAAQIVKRRAEVRQVVVVGDRLLLRPAGLGQFHALVKGDLGLRRLDDEARVPRAAIGAVETAAERMRVAERGVDDVAAGDAEHQFLDADAREPLVLRQQAIVGRGIELVDRLQVVVVFGDADKDGLSAGRVPRGNEAMGVELPDEGDGRNASHACQPARRASSRRRTFCIAGRPPPIM